MIFGSSHPSNTKPSSVLIEPGCGYLLLTREETEQFTKGKPVKKRSGDNRGIFTITAKITRPRSKAKRFPKGTY